MLDANSCCGTCEYSTYDKVNGYVCVNDKSDYVADFVEYSHSCDFWEQKRRNGNEEKSISNYPLYDNRVRCCWMQFK